jgi:hypothetical protein
MKARVKRAKSFESHGHTKLRSFLLQLQAETKNEALILRHWAKLQPHFKGSSREKRGNVDQYCDTLTLSFYGEPEP